MWSALISRSCSLLSQCVNNQYGADDENNCLTAAKAKQDGIIQATATSRAPPQAIISDHIRMAQHARGQRKVMAAYAANYLPDKDSTTDYHDSRFLFHNY